uniref:Uncharacterized protein n=1 Tax=Oryza brachyantha TaxID=4533 RepID=J3LCR2_ORYBR
MCNPKSSCVRHIQPNNLGLITVCCSKVSPFNLKCKGACDNCSI